MKKYNNLINESSPYLLQHAQNPVNWYPWSEEAFRKAKEEDKPIFLSIGYSTCHWCHVMAHESFENQEAARILNDNFISIKVDKEERPDIDSIYMEVCQAFTGSGGWPTSIFMTPDQKPFFAGTYYPLESKSGMVGFMDLLKLIAQKWKNDKKALLDTSDEITQYLSGQSESSKEEINQDMVKNTISYFKQMYDNKNGGFGTAPKFPAPHNLLLLMEYYGITKEEELLEMTETTLMQMYKGGIFDHIGFGFSRYSTDPYFLVPHFEKMLYDNALLMHAYAKMFYLTENYLYKDIAEKTAEFVMREMLHPQGGFYSAQDADSDGVEGKYYVFSYDEIIGLLGKEEGAEFCNKYDITVSGNFEGKNIPNLLKSNDFSSTSKEMILKLYDYRKHRCELHLDDKILTSWNSLMISAFAYMYRVFKNDDYLKIAENANQFIEENLTEDNNVYVSIRDGKRSAKGFLDDYSNYIYALISLYEATLDYSYINKALKFMRKAIRNFYDNKNGGFYIYGAENEQLIMKPKATYDGAVPSGNSIMCYNLIKLEALAKEEPVIHKILEQQLNFMASDAERYPGGYSFYLLSALMYLNPLKKIVCVLADNKDKDIIKSKQGLDADISILEKPTDEYKLINNKTTFYVCKDYSCLPPTNNPEEVF